MDSAGGNVPEGSTSGCLVALLGWYCLRLASLLTLRDAPLTASLKAGGGEGLLHDLVFVLSQVSFQG